MYPAPRPIVAAGASPTPNTNWAKPSRTTATTAGRPITGAMNVTKLTSVVTAASITATGTATIATSAAITTATTATATPITAIMTASATTAATGIGTAIAIGTNCFSSTVLRRPGSKPGLLYKSFSFVPNKKRAGLKTGHYHYKIPLHRPHPSLRGELRNLVNCTT